MLILFFSGTGNTKYVAERFNELMNAACHSIEENVDFSDLAKNHNRICVCYPIYGSRMPRIFMEFVQKHKALFHKKELIILATQFIASGDGARSFVDLFPKDYFKVVYAEHINMPNNICNFPFLPLKNGDENRKKLEKANNRISQAYENINSGKVVRRGFNPASRLLGLVQGTSYKRINNRGRKSVKVDSDCTACGLCVKACPMNNLRLTEGKITHNNDCTLCYRCVNLCPRRAVTAFVNKKPKKQYHGV